jgi:hypothetical protein
MKSYRDSKFKKLYLQLPEKAKLLAISCYKLWRSNHLHPSLHYKKIGSEFRSIRIGDHFRAMARIRNNCVVWFWIGTHEEYNNLFDQIN